MATTDQINTAHHASLEGKAKRDRAAARALDALTKVLIKVNTLLDIVIEEEKDKR